MTTYRCCEIASPRLDANGREISYCKAPPVLTHSHTKATCFACGLAVCTACSRRRRWYRYGHRRVCTSCEAEHAKGEEKRVSSERRRRR